MFDFPWYYYAIFTAILWAVLTLLEKEQLDHDHTLEYITVLAIFTLVVAGFLWPWINLSVPLPTLGAVYVSTLLGTLSMWWGTKGFRHLDVSVAAPLFNLSVVFSVLLAFLFLHETVTTTQGVGIAILIVGSLLLTQKKFHPSFHFGHLHWPKGLTNGINYHSKSFYVTLIVISTVLIALNTLIGKVVLGYIDFVSLIFYSHVFAALNHVIIYGVVAKGYKKLIKGLDGAGPRLVLISVLSIIAQLMFAKALSMQEISLVIPIQRASSVVSTIVGGWIRRERALAYRLVIAVGMVIGIWLVVQ